MSLRSATDASEKLWGPPTVNPKLGYADIWKTDDPPPESGSTSPSTDLDITRPEALWETPVEPDRPVALPDAEPALVWSAPEPKASPGSDPPSSRPRYVLPDTFVIFPKARSWRERLSALGISLALVLGAVALSGSFWR